MGTLWVSQGSGPDVRGQITSYPLRQYPEYAQDDGCWPTELCDEAPTPLHSTTLFIIGPLSLRESGDELFSTPAPLHSTTRTLCVPLSLRERVRVRGR